MGRSSQLRKTADLSEATQRKLNMYVLAAGAAGVSVLALTHPAEGRIVYTPTHIFIAHHGRYLLDLNHDGIADFILRETSVCNSDSCQSQLRVNPAKGGIGAWGRHVRSTGSWGWAYQLSQGLGRIGPRDPFSGTVMGIALSGNTWDYQGPWGGIRKGYLGLKFHIHGQVHYGWARLSVHILGGQPITATLTGYAYETIPGKSIEAGQIHDKADNTGIEEPDASLTAPAPEPATLGLLAAGSPGIAIWRREE